MGILEGAAMIREIAIKIAKEKGYYIPAQPATPEEIATVKQEMSQG